MAARAQERKAEKRSLAAEVLSVLLVAVAAILFLSLITYDSRDLSWHTSGPAHDPSNLIGILGAYTGGSLLQLFGITSLAIPILLVLIAFRMFMSGGRGVAARRALGSSLLLITLSGFISLFPDIDAGLMRNTRNGGVAGYMIEHALASLMNTLGAAIVLTAASILTLMLTMEVSLSDAWYFIRRAAGQQPVYERRSRGSLMQRLRYKIRRRLAMWRSDTVAPTAARATTPLRDPAPLENELPPVGKPADDVAVRAETYEVERRTLEPEIVPARREALAALRAREKEKERETETVITMDPEVAEMVSTASIVRTPPTATTESIRVARELNKSKTRSEITYSLPSIDLLEPPISHHEEAEEELRERATTLAEKCKEFSVTGHIHRINPGPVVTTFEFKPDPGIKYARVVSLADDLCLALKAESIRIDRLPGKSTVGIEVPNAHRKKISIREVIQSSKFQQSESKLTIALGQTINGEVYVADLTKMPHLLIAGATGAGKSVTLNSIICSILYKASPQDVKFIMVDPKRLELGLYEGLPHLLTPIVTDPKRAANALKWATNEMERRYRELAKFGVRNIDQYNAQLKDMVNPPLWDDDPNRPQHLPYIVVAIDELADLMMVARGDVETSIARLAQMARAIGIHLILATQRPSVDIITGVIKANFPSRIAFRVSSKVDSRTIIDSNGAETLLGQGDMLFLPPASSRLIRVHGSFVTEAEIKRITDHTRNQAQPDYNEQVTMSDQETDGTPELAEEHDDLYDEALAIITDMGRASTSVLQRRLSIGYGRAAKILDIMEREGLIGPAEGARPRKVLQPAYEFRDRIEQRIEESDS